MASTRSRGWVVPVVVAVVAALVGAGAVILFVDPGQAAGASVALESATSPGADPFTRSVTIGEVADFPTSIRRVSRTVTATLPPDTTTGGLTTTGNAPGLYGGTGDEGVCDPAQLADYLERTPDKAAAWGATLGVATRAIPAYIATLTPVVLTTDTRVTNHGYTNGHATPRQSVLQAGTAVLVDPLGTPRVKCGCGNPLTDPTSQPIDTTTGTPWPGYQPATVTTITPAPRPQTDFTLTNITTGTTYTQPTGTHRTEGNGGGGDGSTLVAFAQVVQEAEDPLRPRPFLVTHDGGVTWSPMAGTRPTSVGGIAFGKGMNVAVADDQVLVSRAGGAWSPVATLSPTLADVAFGDGEFVAVGGGDGPDADATVYTSTDGRRWQRSATIAAAPGSTGIQPIAIAYGNGTWAILAANQGTGDGSATAILTSTDATTWTRKPGYRYQELGFGGGEWFAFAYAPSISGPNGSEIQVLSSRNLDSWGDAGESPDGSSPYAVTYQDGDWYLAAIDARVLGPLLYTSSDGGVRWTRVSTDERLPLRALAPGP